MGLALYCDSSGFVSTIVCECTPCLADVGCGGCYPGTSLCTTDGRAVCNADGLTYATESCPGGCTQLDFCSAYCNAASDAGVP